MSNFLCEKCETALIDSPTGYATSCEHYPIERREPKFEIFKVGEHYHYFRLLTPNGQVLMVSENYPNLAACENGVELVRANAAWAVTVLPDGKEKRGLL